MEFLGYTDGPAWCKIGFLKNKLNLGFQLGPGCEVRLGVSSGCWKSVSTELHLEQGTASEDADKESGKAAEMFRVNPKNRVHRGRGDGENDNFCKDEVGLGCVICSGAQIRHRVTLI